MPTYKYKCGNCGENFLIRQKMSDLPLEICYSCGGKIQRVISGGTGMIFKGSGFYQTDYANHSQTNSTKNSRVNVSESDKSEKKEIKKETE